MLYICMTNDIVPVDARYEGLFEQSFEYTVNANAQFAVRPSSKHIS